MTVTLVRSYDPAWPAHFRQIERYLAAGLGELDCVIEHVGSTAVPGMVAKPIIDVDVVIQPGAFATVKGRLERLGYEHQGDLGIPEREAFYLAAERTRAALPEHHLFICVWGVVELRRHLAFRDFLRENPMWRARLSRLKLELCVVYRNDRRAYIEGKSAMVQQITELAMAVTPRVLTTVSSCCEMRKEGP